MPTSLLPEDGALRIGQIGWRSPAGQPRCLTSILEALDGWLRMRSSLCPLLDVSP